MMDAAEGKNGKNRILTDDEIIANAFAFILAGYNYSFDYLLLGFNISLDFSPSILNKARQQLILTFKF